jgi:hypothetical protein
MPAVNMSTLAAPIDRTNLGDAIKAAFSGIGLTTAYDDFVDGSGNRLIVYEVVYDAAKTYGKAYLRVRITSGLVVTQALFTAWNATTHAGTNAGSENKSYTVPTGSTLQIVAGRSTDSEWKFLVLNGVGVLGYVVPGTRANWWDLNSYPWMWQPYSIKFSLWQGTDRVPYTVNNPQRSQYLRTWLFGSISTTMFYDNDIVTEYAPVTPVSANPVTGKREIIEGMQFSPCSLQGGICGKINNDFAICSQSPSASALDVFVVSAGTEEWTLIYPGSNFFQIYFPAIAFRSL